MVKVYIDADEWHPCYSINKTIMDMGVYNAELTDKEFAYYVKAMKKFEAWQKLLANKIDK